MLIPFRRSILGFSILGFTEILTFAQMQLSIFILCILDVVALFVIQENFAGHIF